VRRVQPPVEINLLQIKVGYQLNYDLPPPPPMMLVLHIHYSRGSDLDRSFC
jgi:hypothetical protein